MGMPSRLERHWTPDDVRELPDDGQRYECIGGELLVTPSPSFAHQYVVQEFFLALGPFVRAQGLGGLLTAPADVRLTAMDLVQPDLFVCIPKTGLARVRDWTDVSGLLLAVEVLSPSSARHDRWRKRLHYQGAGVMEYWIVDPDARLVELWRPLDDRPEIVRDVLRWTPRADGGTLALGLQAIFAAALDDIA